jgi:hypothetical protein
MRAGIVAAVSVLMLGGCAYAEGTGRVDRVEALTLVTEQQAVHDALRRFVAFSKATYLPVAKDSRAGDTLPEVKGCKLELADRDALIEKHKGEPKAPLITAITVFPTSESYLAGEGIVILVVLESAAITGFDEWPEGVGREFVYRRQAAGYEFVKEVGWVE